MKTTKKWSAYNHFYANGDNSILYNCGSDTVIVLLPQIRQLIDRHIDDLPSLENIHPSLYRFLCEKDMIIDADACEKDLVIEAWRKEETNPETFTMTINPTLDCNLRCWYCYEEHCATMNMAPETVEAIKRLIDRKTTEPQLERLNVGFFGGEPLMKYKQVVAPVLNHARKQCDRYDKQLGILFTTNAVLLTEKVIEELKVLSKNIPVFLQITLDGNREAHDQTRCNPSGGKTFDIILRHIHLAIKAGMEVSVRFNYTNRNISTFADVLQEFEQLEKSEKELISFDFQPVWQDTPSPKSKEQAKRLITTFSQAGLKVIEQKDISTTHCYADHENSIVINYTGELYKCTARNFSPETREGILSPDGELEWGERYKKRMSIKYGTALCQTCRIYPICHGGCSQSKLEGFTGCKFGYTEQDKSEILRKRMMWILEHPDVEYQTNCEGEA